MSLSAGPLVADRLGATPRPWRRALKPGTGWLAGLVGAILLVAAPGQGASHAEDERQGQAVRLELRAGAWLVEQASRLRTTRPSLGVGAAGLVGRVRLDAGYAFSWDQGGTVELRLSNTFHALRARAHWRVPVGAVELTAGGGPLAYLVTTASSVPGEPALLTPALGAELALGAQTVAVGRTFRFEFAGASRWRRVDLHLALVVGL
jgi:hypothetical protein